MTCITGRIGGMFLLSSRTSRQKFSSLSKDIFAKEPLAAPLRGESVSSPGAKFSHLRLPNVERFEARLATVNLALEQLQTRIEMSKNSRRKEELLQSYKALSVQRDLVEEGMR
ncbi:unnamed protein product [Chrysoparadoxa australica]